jgi:hypothetical protein
MKLKLILQILLGIGIIALVYFIYDSVKSPIRFAAEKEARRDVVIQKMKDIRTLQIMYVTMNGRYCSTFDSLIAFAKNEKIPIIEVKFSAEDSLKLNPIKDTVAFKPIIDSLFKDRKDFNIDNLGIIPYSNLNGEKADYFKMTVGTTFSTQANVNVNVIEVFAAYKYFLKGTDYLDDPNTNPEDGLRFGSTSDPSTDGNWE